jgi:hypothetical protein
VGDDMIKYKVNFMDICPLTIFVDIAGNYGITGIK